MLDDFKEFQNNAYDILKNAFNLKKLSHAYLIDANGCADSYSFAIAFAKSIICPYNYTNNLNCKDCNICKRIDDNNFLELKIIKADGLNIKKEQLLDLQNSFSLYGVETTKRVYVILDCEKMTLQASNSILKFLEEPYDNIYAILVTDDVSRVISTIVSRCQIIRLNKSNLSLDNDAMLNFAYMCQSENINEFICNEEYINILNNIISFLKYYEENGLDIIIYSKKMWHNYFKNRSDNIIALKLIINFYFDVLKVKLKTSNLFFNNYIDVLSFVSSKNDLKSIINKLNVSIEALENIKSNLNTMLVIDNMIISYGGD